MLRLANSELFKNVFNRCGRRRTMLTAPLPAALLAAPVPPSVLSDARVAPPVVSRRARRAAVAVRVAARHVRPSFRAAAAALRRPLCLPLLAAVTI